MSEKKARAALFQRFSEDLGAVFPEHSGLFGCPLCLKLFDRNEVDTSLTLEHVIPDGLGKRLPALTCKTCNNNVGGAKLDYHLHKELELGAFFAGDGGCTDVDIHIGGHRLAAKWHRTPGASGPGNKLEVVGRATDPAALEGGKTAFEALRDGSEIILRFRTASPRRANLAILKAGYLLGFLKLGYRFILTSKLDIVREQIRRPAEQLIPLDALIVGLVNPHLVNSVAVVTKPAELEGVVACIQLQPKGPAYSRGVILPHPNSREEFFELVAKLKQSKGSLEIDCETLL